MTGRARRALRRRRQRRGERDEEPSPTGARVERTTLTCAIRSHCEIARIRRFCNRNGLRGTAYRRRVATPTPWRPSAENGRLREELAKRAGRTNPAVAARAARAVPAEQATSSGGRPGGGRAEDAPGKARRGGGAAAREETRPRLQQVELQDLRQHSAGLAKAEASNAKFAQRSRRREGSCTRCAPSACGSARARRRRSTRARRRPSPTRRRRRRRPRCER